MFSYKMWNFQCAAKETGSIRFSELPAEHEDGTISGWIGCSERTSEIQPPSTPARKL